MAEKKHIGGKSRNRAVVAMAIFVSIALGGGAVASAASWRDGSDRWDGRGRWDRHHQHRNHPAPEPTTTTLGPTTTTPKPTTTTVKPTATTTTTTTAAAPTTVKPITTTTTPKPAPGSIEPMLGVYAGGPSGDATATALFGKSQLSATYYQVNQVGNIVPAEEGRIDAGIAPVITFTTKGTQDLADMANKSGAGWTLEQQYVTALKTLSDYAATKHLTVYATLDHEWEVKVNQSTLTGDAATTAVYAKALSNFYSLVETNAPNVVTLYWYGGSDTTAIDAVGSALTVAPDMFSLDPYSGPSHSGTETFTAMVSPKLTWLKGRSWYKGQPIGLSEFGARHTDAQMAAFYSNLRPQMKALGLTWAIFWDRDDTNVVTLTTATYPLSVAAFKASMAD